MEMKCWSNSAAVGSQIKIIIHNEEVEEPTLFITLKYTDSEDGLKKSTHIAFITLVVFCCTS